MGRKKRAKHANVRAWDGRIGGSGGWNIFAKHALSQPCDVCEELSDLVIYDLRYYESDGSGQKWYLCVGCLTSYWRI